MLEVGPDMQFHTFQEQRDIYYISPETTHQMARRLHSTQREQENYIPYVSPHYDALPDIYMINMLPDPDSLTKYDSFISDFLMKTKGHIIRQEVVWSYLTKHRILLFLLGNSTIFNF